MKAPFLCIPPILFSVSIIFHLRQTGLITAIPSWMSALLTRGVSSRCSLCLNVITWTSHTTSGEDLIASHSHHRADAWRKADTLWTSSKWHESLLLFLFLHCSSCCVYPWVWLNATIPVCHFQFFFFFWGGHGSPRSVTQFCVCRWALSGVVVMMRVNQF